MSWTQTPIHVIDFEGTRRSGVVEFGVVTVSGGRILQTRTELCAPTGEMSPEEERLHGIRKLDTAGRPPLRGHAEYFLRLRRGGVLAAHHASVEAGLIGGAIPSPGYAPDWARPGEEVAGWGPWVDTRALYAQLYPDLDTHKLGGLVAVFRLAEPLKTLAAMHCPPGRRRAHCALYDALASALLLIRLGQDEPEVAGRSLPWLIQASAPSASAREDMRQGELF